MKFTIEVFDHDLAYRGISVIMDRDVIYQATSGNYLLDLKRAIETIEGINPKITPTDLSFTSSVDQ